MNVNNIINLIKAYFYENWKNDLLYNFVIVMALALFFTFKFNNMFDIGAVYFVVSVLAVYYPCRLFSKLSHPSSRMHYLMIPATNGEKVLAGLLLANIYYVVGMVLSMAIGILLGLGLLKIVKPDIVWDSNSLQQLLPSSGLSVLMLYTSISVSFFAAIYFKKSPFWKMLLVGFVVSTVLGIVMTATVWLNAKAVLPAGAWPNSYIKTENYVVTGNDWFPYVACCIAMLYWYAMSFLRMRETEA